MTITQRHRTDIDRLDSVVALENTLLTLPQVDLNTEHIFEDTKYIRRITVPPYTVLTGAEHKTDYTVRLLSGRIIVTTDRGTKEFFAPCEFHAPAGTRRAGYTLEEGAVWEDIYYNEDNCTDLSVIEDRLYVVPEIGMQATRTEEQKARIDYMAFVRESGLSHEEIQYLVEFDNVRNEDNDYLVYLDDSKIHGTGLFAAADFSENDIICPAKVGEHRTNAGRYTNHSGSPNACFEKLGDDLLLVAKRRIFKGEELTVDYRQALVTSLQALQIRGMYS